MNRFRSRKKSADDGDKKGRSRRGSIEDDVPPVPSFPSKTFGRRNKKVPPEPKPEIDLSTALPTTEDFRTSLLMPSLSTRFSMLRDQDDPTSKIGKASDDSVLFPKRASRLDLFNRGNLGDIAEVDSLRGSIRPPFASPRTESFSTDGYGTDEDASRNGSVMSRARPGEGNILFGGRQKIYKIPVDGAGSVKSFGEKEDGDVQPRGGMSGKVVYDDDVAMSAFQRLREQERQERRNREQLDFGTASARSSKEDERSNSPPQSYNRNRETTSSTNSARSQPRTSTAATSVASQKSMYAGPSGNGSSGALPPSASGPHHSERHGPKGKRLYGNGLDQHMYEQQFSALHRLESVNRQRHFGGSGRGLQGSRSATNLNDRFQRSGPSFVSASFRPGSPPPSVSPLSTVDNENGAVPDSSTGSPLHHVGSGFAPPMSPPLSPEQDPTLVAALEPNDLGKATASGVFNKPKKQYNEQQYLQRQLQLQQGRETPPLRSFSPSVGLIDEQTSGRTRNSSNASSVRNQHEPSSTEQHMNPVPENGCPRDITPGDHHPPPDMNGTFFAPPSASEASTPSVRSPSALSQTSDFITHGSARGSATSSIPTVLHEAPQQSGAAGDQSDYIHRQDPQHLSGLPEEPVADSLSQRTVTRSHKGSISDKSKPENLEVDFQSIGPTNGLSGLVRSHLRNVSDQSSIYPEQSPGLLSKFPNDSLVADRASRDYQHQTFFDDEEGTKPPEPRASQDSRYSETAVPPPLAFTAQRMLHQATALKNETSKAQQILGNDKAQRILGKEAPRTSHASKDSQDSKPPSWEQQIKAHHARGGSTETQKEREALASEMETRSRMIQDKLKNIVEVDSRSGSPHPSHRNSPGDSPAKPGAPFAILKTKGSKGSLRNDKAPKAMKMLGLGPPSSSRRPENSQPKLSAPEPQGFHPAHRQQGPSHALADERTSPEASGSRPSSRKGTQPGSELTSPRSHLNYAGRHRSNSRTTANTPNTQYFDNRSVISSSSAQTPSLVAPSPSPRPSPAFSTHSAPAVPQQLQSPPGNDNSPPAPSCSQPAMMPYQNPTMTNPPSQSHHSHSRHHHAPPSYRKGSINKYDISEPTFLSSTSAVTTVDLPPGASLSNGMELPPPIPPFNPRRKRTRILLDKLGRLEKPPANEAVAVNELKRINNAVGDLLRTSPPSSSSEAVISPSSGETKSDISRAERDYQMQLKAFQAQHQPRQRGSEPWTYSEHNKNNNSILASPPRSNATTTAALPSFSRNPNPPSPSKFDPGRQHRTRTRQRIRKTSSEGANMATRAKQQRDNMYPVSPIEAHASRSAAPGQQRFGGDGVGSGTVSPIEGPRAGDGGMF